MATIRIHKTAGAALLAALLFHVPAPASAVDCLRAIFFDLGDTLVAAAGGGMFALRPGAQDLVDELQARGFELGIITNVPAGWDREDLEAILLEPEFLDEFDVLVLSSQAPAPKPNPAIYTFAHAALPTPLPITATAFVGETLAEIADVQDDPTSGARATGMIGIHLSNAAASPLADFTIPTDLTTLALLDVVEATCNVFLDGFESEGTAEWSSCTGCPI
jgi:hypothetical protein